MIRSLISVVLLTLTPYVLAQTLAGFEKGDVSLRLVANRADIPGINTQTTQRAQAIWALESYKNKIYIGYGDWAANTGPIDIVAFNPASSTFGVEGRVRTEAIENYKVLDGALYGMVTDASGGEVGTMVWQGAGSDQWFQAASFSDAVHAFDVTKHNGRVYLATGGTNGRIHSTSDNGNTWNEEYVSGDRYRFYHIGSDATTVFATANDQRAVAKVNNGAWFTVNTQGTNPRPITINGNMKLLYGSGFSRLEGAQTVVHSKIPYEHPVWPVYNVAEADGFLGMEVLFLAVDIGDTRREIFATVDFENFLPVYTVADQEKDGSVDVMKNIWQITYHDNNLYFGTLQGHLYRIENVLKEVTNLPPVASAGENQVVYDEDSDGSVRVNLNGLFSTDPDGDIEAYQWSLNGVDLSFESAPTFNLPHGEHKFTLTVFDVESASSSEDVFITVSGMVENNIAQGKEISALTEWGNGYAAIYANDGDVMTTFASAENDDTVDLTLDLAGNFSLSKTVLVARQDCCGGDTHVRNNFKIEGYNASTGWSELYSQKEQSFTAYGALDVDLTGIYSKLRVRLINANDHFNIGEWYVFGKAVVAETDPTPIPTSSPVATPVVQQSPEPDNQIPELEESGKAEPSTAEPLQDADLQPSLFNQNSGGGVLGWFGVMLMGFVFYRRPK